MSGNPQTDPAPETPEENRLGAAQHVQTDLNLPRAVYVVAVNILVLAELCVAMYMATQDPDEFTPVFFKVFFSLLGPTLVLAAVGKRLLPKAKP